MQYPAWYRTHGTAHDPQRRGAAAVAGAVRCAEQRHSTHVEQAHNTCSSRGTWLMLTLFSHLDCEYSIRQGTTRTAGADDSPPLLRTPRTKLRVPGAGVIVRRTVTGTSVLVHV